MVESLSQRSSLICLVISSSQIAFKWLPLLLISDFRIRLPAEDDLSVAAHVRGCDLQRLNTDQTTAVKRSLRGRFTLIQGPPGNFP